MSVEFTEERLIKAEMNGAELTRKEKDVLKYFHDLPLSDEKKSCVATMPSIESFKLLQSAFSKVEIAEERGSEP